jgi:hypothetical protein
MIDMGVTFGFAAIGMAIVAAIIVAFFMGDDQ